MKRPAHNSIAVHNRLNPCTPDAAAHSTTFIHPSKNPTIPLEIPRSFRGNKPLSDLIPPNPGIKNIRSVSRWMLDVGCWVFDVGCSHVPKFHLPASGLRPLPSPLVVRTGCAKQKNYQTNPFQKNRFAHKQRRFSANHIQPTQKRTHFAQPETPQANHIAIRWCLRTNGNKGAARQRPPYRVWDSYSGL